MVGNGAKVKFWESAWLDGRAPRDLALNLYKLAWRKNQFVKEDLTNDNWTRGLWHMTESAQMAELVTLWSLIIVCQLTEEEDTITWRWTKHGMYTRRSAYRAQFVGSYSTFNTRAIWSSKTEGNIVSLHGYWCKRKYSL
jgi:hypothetical protein